MQKLNVAGGLALLSFGLWATAAVTLRLAIRKGHRLWLEEVPPASDEECPSLCIVVPACNEAGTIEPAARSLLSMDYPRLEIIAINDRSTDDTGVILERLAAEDPRLRVVHVTDLPAGWLGKNHAMWRGALQGQGEIILFTDADVVYLPDAVRRAVNLALETGADHVTAGPWLNLEGFWERVLVSYFLVIFSLHFRPWEVQDPSSPAYVGIGAFNMVRREAYMAIGGHQALPMEVADDVKLGKVFKTAGKKSVYILAGPLIQVRWVSGLRGFVNGLTKNAYAGLEYRMGYLVFVTLALVATNVFPAVGLVFGSCFTRIASAGCLAAMAVCATPPRFPVEMQQRLKPVGDIPRSPGWPEGLAYPLAAVIWTYTLWRSALIAEMRGGIEWRGTFYPLEELRRGVV